jgi:LysM repeat protein
VIAVGYRGKHRSPTRTAVKVARIAVGGLALAAITGEFNAIPAAHASTPMQMAPACGHNSSHHGGAHHGSSHHAVKPKHVAVKAVAHAAPKPATPPAPAPQPAPAATPDLFTHYVVQPGDTLTHIAASFNLPWSSLWSANPEITNPDVIHVGQLLRLPS